MTRAQTAEVYRVLNLQIACASQDPVGAEMILIGDLNNNKDQLCATLNQEGYPQMNFVAGDSGEDGHLFEDFAHLGLHMLPVTPIFFWKFSRRGIRHQPPEMDRP